VQAFRAWSPPGGTLGQIVSETRLRVDELKRIRHALETRAAAQPSAPSFAAALRRPDVAVVAEVKRRSPSRGDINVDLSPAQQAADYHAGGAAAISVLTEPQHFGGSGDDLIAVRSAARIPVLKKDFHIDPVQLLEARALGASAVLLIARALDPGALVDLVTEAAALGLEALIEVRAEAELERALSTHAPVIGVNARDLETLSMDLAVTERLLPLIPYGRVAIAESGVTSRADVERAASCGADAVLVGSAVSAAADAAAAVRALTGVVRGSRAA
jgi:indole-3-glycerol phosphate synthase